MSTARKLAARLVGAGWRRLGYAGFCLLLIAAGARYLYCSDGVGARGNWKQEIAAFQRILPVAMIGFGLLAIASRWLISRGPLRPLAPSVMLTESSFGERFGERRGFWLAVAICTLASGLLWSQRLDRSLWTDEITSMRRSIVGRWKHKNGEGHLLRPTLADTLLTYETPNNHVAYSVVAKILHNKLAGVNETDFTRPYFDAKVLRLPSFVAGLACIALIGYLALRLHSLLAAWLAMSWATLHPWMLEYSTSARGYAFAMCFLAVAAVAAVRIFRCGGGWRWWVVYGMGQMFAFWSIPTLVHGLIGLNLAVFAGLLLDRSVDPAARRGHLGAFFASTVVAGIGAVLVFYPKLEQLRSYLAGEQFDVDMPLSWMGDCVSNLLVGQPFASWEEGHPWAFSLDQWPLSLFVLAAVLGLLLAIASLWRGWRGGVFTGLLAIACFLPHLTVFLQGKAMHFFLFPWYSVWGLPLWIVFFAIGGTGLVSKVTKNLPRWAAPLTGAVLVLIFAAATYQPRRAYLNVSVEPQMESAASFRDSPNPWAPGHDSLISVSLITANHAYDPWNRRLRGIDDLWEQIARAEETGKPLYCDTAWIERVPDDLPEFAPLMLDQRYFERVEKFYGLQPQNSRYILRYRPGSLRDRLSSR